MRTYVVDGCKCASDWNQGFAGDCDTIPWPMRSDFATQSELMERLQSALYDEREMNPFFPADAVIALPDNTIVEF